MRTYHITTYGCQMNHNDSERIAAILEKINLKSARYPNEADLIIFNACSVRQSAIDRIYGQINKIKKSKINPIKTALTGCVLESDKKKLADKFDLIFNIKELTKLPQLLKAKRSFKADYLSIPPRYKTNYTTCIPISTGCNNYCSYCVVPYTRGPEHPRLRQEIIRETKQAVKNGAKEILLMGQNVNSYPNFAELIQKINNLPGDFWIRFISNHPKNMSNELIRAIAQSEKVCAYIQLPIQSGDNTILKKMNRHYTVEHYKKLIKKIRQKIPGVAISTDIIVGFPGETKKQFENTARLMRDIEFDMAYIARYSPRPGTAAAHLEDNITLTEKKRREKVLTRILKQSALKNNKKYLHQNINVLIDEIRDGFAFGKTRTHKTVKIPFTSGNLYQGQILIVQITQALAWGLKGKITKAL